MPVLRDGFTGILDRHTGKNIKYELKFDPNCNVCYRGMVCKSLDRKSYVLNSNYCRSHMNCKC